MNTTPLLDRQSEVHAFPEASAEVAPATLAALGHLAVSEQLPETEGDIDSGLEQLEAYANSQFTGTRSAAEAQVQPENEASTKIQPETPADNRVHDIEAAHEAALAEHKIFKAHVEALRENELFDAHVAAEAEDKERTAIKAKQPEQPSQAKEQPATTDTAESEKASSPLEISSPAEIRQEATKALEEAGLNGLAAQVPPGSEVHKSLDGKELTIVNGNSARVITRIPGGRPQITEYTYDKDNSTLTVTNGANPITGRVVEYEPTQAEQWQTRDKIITLPPALAKRFGLERAMVVSAE
jgi:predicted ATP-dependent protease